MCTHFKYLLPHNSAAQILGVRSQWRLSVVQQCLIFVGRSTKRNLYHLSGARNFEVGHRFWKICAPLSHKMQRLCSTLATPLVWSKNLSSLLNILGISRVYYGSVLSLVQFISEEGKLHALDGIISMCLLNKHNKETKLSSTVSDTFKLTVRPSKLLTPVHIIIKYQKLQRVFRYISLL